ncbi:cutinase family protein [Mycobacterium sp. NAZ190054]|uniref:cutinase family protein n=1 Tax=Mycobacterium sp. NAZ190054 TaxID=1747766 RepID=UPI00079A0FB7|nr:cutinase family protein [Mycobacterium sp. NAZ190054]KWX67864.1 cutinase [Mycobacterium sp. NAZ190054]
MSDHRSNADAVSGGSVRRALVLAGAGGVLAAGLIGPGAASAQAQSCPDVEVVFARGTAEPAGIGRVGDAFVDALRHDLAGRTVDVYAVSYPASYDFLQSTPVGADDASAHIQATAASCPATSIVLGGYSQGAAAVDLITADPNATFGFGRPMPPAVADHVAAVAVFGNPSTKIGRPLTSISPLYGGKTIDLCNGADPVCSDGDDRPAHSQYVQTGLAQQAADFVAAKLGGHNRSDVLVNASGSAVS